MHYLSDLVKEGMGETALGKAPFSLRGKKRVNLLALGDVGGMLLTGLALLGGDVVESIGIYDVNEQTAARWELEISQIAYPWDYGRIPPVKRISAEELFDCDAFIFCASKAVPAVGAEVSDVRMVQFEANRSIVCHYAALAAEKGFCGLFAVVSDPVDPLCKAALLQGLPADQVQGYGLGVMNSRAAYFAKRDDRFASFLTEGRAFGPHGSDLVIANSIANYDDGLSRELTRLTVEANLRVREIGFKPFIAPALSSGAISILLTLRGEWHYSSTCLGGTFMGAKNRMTAAGPQREELALPAELFERIKIAYKNLEKII